jgi:hypothetical protein
MIMITQIVLRILFPEMIFSVNSTIKTVLKSGTAFHNPNKIQNEKQQKKIS